MNERVVSELLDLLEEMILSNNSYSKMIEDVLLSRLSLIKTMLEADG